MEEDTSNHPINKEYPNYGGLDREALFFNVPIVVAMLLLVAGCVPTLILFQFHLGIYSLLPAVMALAVLAHLSHLCSEDDQAMRINKIEMGLFFRRKNTRIFGGTTTILSTRYGRHKNDYRRLFKQYFEETTSQFGFSPKDLPTLDSRNSELY